jgi:hypothetical protein
MQSFLERNLVVGHMTSIRMNTCEHERFVLRRQEFAMLRERRYDWPASYADEDSDAA